MSRCPNCRRPVDEGDRVCDFCDEPLDQEQDTQGTSPPQRGQQQPTERQTPQTGGNKSGRQRGQNTRDTNESQRGQRQPTEERTPQTGGGGERSDSPDERNPKRGDNYSGQRTHQNAASSSGQTPGGSDEQRGKPRGPQSHTGPGRPGQPQSGNQRLPPSQDSNASDPADRNITTDASFDQKSEDISEAANINGVAWWVGWRPFPIIISGAVVGLLLAILMEFGIEPMIVSVSIGSSVGFGIFYWGTTEINNNYTTLRDNFIERSRARAEDKSGLTASDYTESYGLRIGFGRSPPFVEPTKKYEASYGFLTDVSLDLDYENIYDMKGRTEAQEGRQRQVFYDNMEDVQINDRGNETQVIIKTSAGDNVPLNSADKTQAEALLRDLRKKLRDVRRQRR